MVAQIFKVVSVGQPFEITSTKTESGKMMKNTCVLQSLGGKYEDAFLVSLFDRNAFVELHQGDLVIAKLAFSVREVNQSRFMDATAQEIVKVG